MTVYLFDSDKLHYKDPTSPHFAWRKVEPRTLRCHNVKITRHSASNWSYDFQIVGGDDTWFFTNYDWALVVDSPENLANIARKENLQAEHQRLLQILRDAETRVQTARSVHIREQNERANDT